MLGAKHFHPGHTAPVGPMGMFSALRPLCSRNVHVVNPMGGCMMEKLYSRFSCFQVARLNFKGKFPAFSALTLLACIGLGFDRTDHGS